MDTGLLMAAIVLFAATNIDDLFLLIVIHSDHRRKYPPQAVLIGQLIGFSLIIAVSLLGYGFHILIPGEWLACMGVFPLVLGTKQLAAGIAFRLKRHSTATPPGSFTGAVAVPRLPTSWRRTSTKLAALTIANGSDNISVYLPTFSRLNLHRLLLTLTIFYGCLIGLWSISNWLALHPRWQDWIQTHGPLFSPLVLISLGFWLLKDSVIWLAFTSG